MESVSWMNFRKYFKVEKDTRNGREGVIVNFFINLLFILKYLISIFFIIGRILYLDSSVCKQRLKETRNMSIEMKEGFVGGNKMRKMIYDILLFNFK